MDWFNAIRAARFHYLQVAFPGASDSDVSFPAGFFCCGFFYSSFPLSLIFSILLPSWQAWGSAPSFTALNKYWAEITVVGCRAHVRHLLAAPSLGTRVREHARVFTRRARVVRVSNPSAVTEAVSIFLKDFEIVAVTFKAETKAGRWERRRLKNVSAVPRPRG